MPDRRASRCLPHIWKHSRPAVVIAIRRVWFNCWPTVRRMRNMPSYETIKKCKLDNFVRMIFNIFRLVFFLSRRCCGPFCALGLLVFFLRFFLGWVLPRFLLFHSACTEGSSPKPSICWTKIPNLPPKTSVYACHWQSYNSIQFCGCAIG